LSCCFAIGMLLALVVDFGGEDKDDLKMSETTWSQDRSPIYFWDAGSLTQKSGVIPGSTPVRPPGLGDASKLIPTLLDYANEQNVSPSKSTTDKSATGTGSSTGSATSPGLSLLASSAASQKTYMVKIAAFLVI
jgi:hypothetical protein